ncbi:hypothetical protein CQW23_15906 [Capsicum baccatum]|uniref:Rab5-interacting protein n=2 Tax=Capsicum TaxID=4071 RepID=A0A2G2ZE98_CAPAN|nr:respirasome Complex Assembly Factor 1 [Capsicum annuum]KAF3650496.1 hypothetical protein FXO38_17108 [Capsicum annuum]PHT46748.1 hypothetical protein CQW23_15906 [Capsicum baccatum]PHT80215.1 hypothetical protein T459_18267 [Capsicum annuum]
MRQRKKSNTEVSQQQDQHQNAHLSKFRQLFDPEASWDKDQLGDVLHWTRQLMALVCGLIWGAIPLVGGVWFMLFLALSTGIIYCYYALVLKVDEEDFGGHGALLQEGLFASMTLFLLFWTLVYSLAHF